MKDFFTASTKEEAEAKLALVGIVALFAGVSIGIAILHIQEKREKNRTI